MSPEQLSQERRRGRFAAVAAIVSGLAFVAGAIWYQAVNADAPDGKNEDADVLRYFDRHGSEYLGASILQAFGIAAAGRGRGAPLPRCQGAQPRPAVRRAGGGRLRPGRVRRQHDDARRHLHDPGRRLRRPRGSDRSAVADDLLDTPVLDVANVLGLTGVLALGFWLVKGSLDAMRIGLLTRFMGVLGIALGPALVLGFGLLVLPLLAGRPGRAVPRPLAARHAAGLDHRQGGAVAQRQGMRRRDEPPPADAGGGRNGEVDAVGPGVRKPGTEPGDAETSRRAANRPSGKEIGPGHGGTRGRSLRPRDAQGPAAKWQLQACCVTAVKLDCLVAVAHVHTPPESRSGRTITTTRRAPGRRSSPCNETAQRKRGPIGPFSILKSLVCI